MIRSLVVLGILTLAVGCSESSGSNQGGGGAGGGEPPAGLDVAVETYNLALAGSFIAYEQQRRELLPDAIANSDADILCLQEVWTQADKEAIRDAAAANFPNVFIVEDNLLTPLDDPEDQNGDIPPLPTEVPCPEGDAKDDMDAAIDCAAQECNTLSPGDENGQTTSIDCAIADCLPAVASLLLVPRCYACLATQLPTSTFAQIRSSCPTVVEQDLAFEGQNGVMILSRYPLKDTVSWVIPGTWNRRVIMSATAELPGGHELDVYCNHLTPVFSSIAFPYTGQYGDGQTGAPGWEAELLLQAQKLIDYVDVTSGETPAVILGDLNAGRDYPAQDIFADGEAALDLLETAFTPAYAADYVPQCTFCIENPVREPEADDVSNWIDHIHLYNLAATSVVRTERTFDEDVLPVDGMMVPLSDHFGMRSVIRVPGGQ
jgi:endonuclease/exonuclease/phosphatase family metal-dependent hydrolase